MTTTSNTQKAIIKGSEFKVSDFKYTAPKPNASGGKSVGILNASVNRALYLETPQMTQWGIGDYEGNEKYEMSLSFPSSDYSTPETDAFLQAIIDFENKIKEDAVTNSKEWFGKAKMTSDMIDVLFSSKLKYPKDKVTQEPNGKPPLLSVKVPYYDGKWMTYQSGIYDEEYQQLFPNPEDPSVTPLSLVKKGKTAKLVIQSGGLWFANQKFGITWKVDAIMIKNELQLSAGGCPFTSSLDNSIRSEEVAQNVTNEPTSHIVEDSDGEQEQETQEVSEVEASEVEEEEEEIIQPPPPPIEEVKKKKVVKKVVKKAAVAEQA
jgi:hypothetical protein